VPISTNPVAADEFFLAQVLRKNRILDRPEQRRVHAHQPQREEQHDQVAPIEADCADDHDRDFEHLDEPDQSRFSYLSAIWPRSPRTA